VVSRFGGFEVVAWSKVAKFGFLTLAKVLALKARKSLSGSGSLNNKELPFTLGIHSINR